MQELQITMLGASGVGKTSLLTAIYEQFESTIGRANLQLTPDDHSSAILQKRLAELRNLTTDFLARGGVKGTEAPLDPSTLRSFIFDIGAKGKQPAQRLYFRDYPGGYMTAEATSQQRDFVKQLLRDSVAVLLTIDATALMEEDGRWHEQINRPLQMTNLFKAAYQELDSPRLVILAPVKCETYLREPNSRATDLLQNIRVKYANLLNYLNSEPLFNNVAVVVTPVQTVGSVIYSRIEEKADEEGKLQPLFYFRKTRFKETYQPRDSEQPLLYLLRFLLKLDIESRRFPGSKLFRKWLGMDRLFQDAVQELKNGCKTTGGFAVLQGERWLKVN
jgi:hypothetical protein